MNGPGLRGAARPTARHRRQEHEGRLGAAGRSGGGARRREGSTPGAGPPPCSPAQAPSRSGHAARPGAGASGYGLGREGDAACGHGRARSGAAAGTIRAAQAAPGGGSIGPPAPAVSLARHWKQARSRPAWRRPGRRARRGRPAPARFADPRTLPHGATWSCCPRDRPGAGGGGSSRPSGCLIRHLWARPRSRPWPWGDQRVADAAADHEISPPTELLAVPDMAAGAG